MESMFVAQAQHHTFPVILKVILYPVCICSGVNFITGLMLRTSYKELLYLWSQYACKNRYKLLDICMCL